MWCFCLLFFVDETISKSNTSYDRGMVLILYLMGDIYNYNILRKIFRLTVERRWKVGVGLVELSDYLKAFHFQGGHQLMIADHSLNSRIMLWISLTN